MRINFKQCHSKNYSMGRTKAIKYIVIHYTSNNGDTAKKNVEYYATSTPIASAHYFVDELDEVWQSVRDVDTAWHCGASTYRHAGCRNANSIGIEMCSRKDSGGVYYIKEKTIKNAVQLARQLMRDYDIPIENVIRHYDVTGKICPEPFVRNESQWVEIKKLLMSEDMPNAMPTVIEAKYYPRSEGGYEAENEFTVPSIMIDGITFSNARLLLDALGFDVYWDAATATRVVNRRQ